MGAPWAHTYSVSASPYLEETRKLYQAELPRDIANHFRVAYKLSRTLRAKHDDEAMVFSTTFRVRWGDTDIAGVMHFANYFRYVEECEQEFYRAIGFTLTDILDKYGIMLPRIEVSCQYKAACRFDDQFEVRLRISEVGTKTITYRFELVKSKADEVAAEGHVKCIAVDRNWKTVPLPEKVVEILQNKIE